VVAACAVIRLARAPRRRRVVVVPGQLLVPFVVPALILALSAADEAVEAVEETDAAAPPSAPAIRLVLLEGYRDAYGEPRPALLIPGRPTPAVFDGIAAALVAKAHLEAAAR
jgi:hypothetical protein